MPTTQEYKTINGHTISTRTPTPTATGFSLIDGNFKSMADLLQELAARTNRGLSSGAVIPTVNNQPDAAINDWYICTTNGNWYELQQSGWVVLLEMKGDAGTPGTNGTDGATVSVTSTAPSNASDGDLYINPSTWTLYKRVSDSWINQGSWMPNVDYIDAADITTSDLVDHTLDETPGADNSITLADMTRYHCTHSAISGIELKAGTGLQCAVLRAVSSGTAYEFIIPADWVAIGSDCTDGVHTPSASTRYEYTIMATGDSSQPYTVYCVSIPYITA
jgi:hypothetical protein